MNTPQVQNKQQSERISRPSFFSSTSIFPKLTINKPNDKYEQEADSMAEKVMTMPKSSIQRTCAACAEEEESLQTKPLIQRQESEEEEETLQTKSEIQRKEEEEEEEEEPVQAKLNYKGYRATAALQNQLQASKGGGSPLPSSTNQHMSNAFGHDFSNVRIHTDQTASKMNQNIQAKAFTHGSDIYMNEGQYNPNSSSGQKLLAHELTHVVQQSAVNSTSISKKPDFTIQRGTLEGIDNMCVDYAGRDLRSGDSNRTIPPSQEPGGTVEPNTSGQGQNCAGVSLCNRTEWVNWPYLGLETSNGSRPDARFTANWDTARYFVPRGCTFVESSGVGLNSTRCNQNEREIIVFLYRWPVGHLPQDSSVTIYRSDFHMIGRDCSNLPSAWESKMDRRERVTNIQDPQQSLYDAYPHTRQSNREIVRLTFCCECDMIGTS